MLVLNDRLSNSITGIFYHVLIAFTQRTLSSLELPRAVSVAIEPSMSIPVGESPSNDSQERTDVGVQSGSFSMSQYNVKQRHKAQDPARDISIQVLEKFSLVTKFARETTSQLFRETHSNGYGKIDRRSHIQSSLDYPQKAPNVEEKVPDEIPLASDPLEVTFCYLCVF